MQPEIRAVYLKDKGYVVGWEGVTKIERYEQNLGSYGIQWYVIYKGDVQDASVNALHTIEVRYAQ